jgi:hypothetical protein
MSHVDYHIGLKNRLKHQFKNVDLVTKNYSQLHQDLFVCSMLDGKTHGTYLEIGAWLPVNCSNTYLLENTFNWKGVSVEIVDEFVEQFRNERKNPIICGDARLLDYDTIISKNNLGNNIDYLSCDIDPPLNTLSALLKINHDKVRFKVITFEHDLYTGTDGQQVREDSRKILSNLGYEMVINDIGWDGRSVEDWWVDPAQINRDIINKFKINYGYWNDHNTSVMFL